MKLSETSIRRPVLASMFSAALVLFGVIGYTRLSVRELPDIDPPIISVSTTLPGANAQVVETAVTDVLEEELSTIQGLRTLSSSSSEENSQITLEFTLDRAVDVAAQDVRDKVSRVRGRLPQCRNPRGPDRIDAARVLGSVAGRAQDPAGIRRVGRGQPGHPAREAQGRRPGRARSGG